MKILRAVGPVAVDAVLGRSAPRQPIQPEQIRAGASAVGMQLTDAQVANAQNAVQRYVDLLLRAADRDADPLVYYELLRDALSEAQVSELKKNLTEDSWCASLFGSDPRIVQRLDWFNELRDLILKDGQRDTTEPQADSGGAPEPSSAGPGVSS